MTRSYLRSLFCLSQARQPATLSTAFVCRTQVDLMDLTLAPSDAVDKHHRRLFRLASHKRRTQELAQWLSAQGLLTPRLARLPHCRSWMIFRHYPELDLIRLANTRSCDLSLLCPLCAIRRAARASSAYQQRVRALLARNPGLTLSYA